MAIIAKEQFFNSQPGKSVRLFCTWKTEEEVMVLFQALLPLAGFRALGCEFDFHYKNVSIWFSMSKDREVFLGHLRELEAQQTESHQTD